MRRIISIAIISLILFNISGNWFVFKSQQFFITKSIKKKLKEGVPDNELTTLGFSLNKMRQLEWLKPGKEFRYGSELFDVVNLCFRNGKIWLNCINDTQEKSLFVHLEKMVEEEMWNQQMPGNFSKTLKKLLLQQWFFHNVTENVILSVPVSFSHFYFSRSNSVLLSVSNPPPEKLS